MNKEKSEHTAKATRRGKPAEDFRALSRRILRGSNRSVPRVDYLREVSMMLIKFSLCDAMELWVKEDHDYFRCRTVLCLAGCYHFQVISKLQFNEVKNVAHPKYDENITRLAWKIIQGRFDASLSSFTEKGSFWTGDLQKADFLSPKAAEKGRADVSWNEGDYKSLALIPIMISRENIGLLQLKSRQRSFFTKTEIKHYERVSETLALTLVNQQAQAALRERVKELTCLYGIAKAAERPGAPLREVLQSIVELFPPAWQYPEITHGRIIVDGCIYATPGFLDSDQRQMADIIVSGEGRGVVEVVYSEKKPDLYEGPFLKEERSLINTIARQVALIIERREAAEDRVKLQDQLRHADRLATIGQLAAGVAHELNEPLGNILGFAQLAQKGAEMPDQTRQDVEKIINASLYAREVVNKLKLFARQTPPQKTQLDLNQLIEEGLMFLESRCAKAGIELVRSLSPNLPEITADQGQLHQVLVNLVVNSIQAMPEGGKLIIRTAATPKHVSLIVEDTGAGMSHEVKKKIFIPFFTTKDVTEGTGLGLAVVDGIVRSHDGSIEVESKVGRGTRFEVQLPLKQPQNGQESE